MNIGDFRTRRKQTGKFFFADDATSSQYRDYGNVLLLKQEPKIDRAQQLTAQKGYVQVTHEEPSKVDLRWSVKADEHATDLVGLLHLADAPSATNQSSTSGTAWSVTAVKQGYSYYVGAMSLSSFVVTGKTITTDYTIDLGSGMLYIVPGGNIADSTDIAGTYNSAALSISTYTGLTKMFKRGYARVLLFDQNTTVPREVATFRCELYVSDWGDHDGQKYNEPTLMLLAVDAPVVKTLELS